MTRGEIYFIRRRDTIGAEIAKSRPGIIVSNNALNDTSDVLEVVYLTTQPKRSLPTHVTINATGVQAVALCEQIDHVSKWLVGDFCGLCTPEEMAEIDKALAHSLGLDGPIRAPEKNPNEHTPSEQRESDLYFALVRTCAERDIYKALVDRLIKGSEG